MITEEDLINALTEQLRSTPPLLSVLREENRFSNSELIQLVKMQVQSGLEIKTILVEKSLLSKDELSQFLKLQNQKRMPLGQILIEMGKLTIDDCQNALDDYGQEQQNISLDEDGDIDLSKIDDLGSLSTSVDKLVEPGSTDAAAEIALSVVGENASVKSSESNQSAELAIPEIKFEPIQEFVLDEYLEVLDELKKDEMDQTIMAWSKLKSSLDLKESFRLFYRELHTLKGTVRFLRGLVSEFVIHTGEDLLAELIVLADQLQQTQLVEIEDYYLSLNDMVWELRVSLAQNISEKSLWDTNDFQEKLKRFLVRSSELKSLVDNLLQNQSADDVKSQF